jgi:diketogulonate reductase-like aldo/keto reductase
VTGNGRELGGRFALGPRRVHRAGYGAMQLAGDGVFGPPRDRDEALRVLRAAVAAGVDHVDTAQYYGAGTVNELIREALYPYPDSLAIVSKVAAGRDDDGALLRQGIEDNLATLGADRLAAVNLRVMDPSETPGRQFDALLAALVQAREEGLIGGIGLSNVSHRHLLRAAAQTEIVCVQNLFNLADQRSLDVLTECRARNIAFVPFCPLGWPGEVRSRLLADPSAPPTSGSTTRPAPSCPGTFAMEQPTMDGAEAADRPPWSPDAGDAGSPVQAEQWPYGATPSCTGARDRVPHRLRRDAAARPGGVRPGARPRCGHRGPAPRG